MNQPEHRDLQLAVANALSHFGQVGPVKTESTRWGDAIAYRIVVELLVPDNKKEGDQ